MELPETTLLKWTKQFRIIPSKFLPINFFEKLVDPAQMEEIFYLESLTNDRLREEVGDLSLVQKEDRISGEGASVVMAAFTHIGKSSRFSNGDYGVYYAARDLNTAIKETVFWRAKFLSYTEEDPGTIDMRVYVGKIIKSLHDIRNMKKYAPLHDPNNYLHSQAFGARLKDAGAYGIVYNSVRDPGGQCIAALRPTAVSIPKQGQHLAYVWDGHKIISVYEKSNLFFENKEVLHTH